MKAISIALVLTVAAHVGPVLADDNDPTFEPLVTNSIFKPVVVKTIIEPQGISSLLARERKPTNIGELKHWLQASPRQTEGPCACGNYLIWEEFGRRQREGY